MRRRLALGLVLTVLLGACGMPEEEVTSGSTTTAAPGAGWEQLPPSPLPPRGGAVLVPLEEGRLLVVGGDLVAGCIDHGAPRDAGPPSGQSTGASSGPAVVSTAALSCVPPKNDPRRRDGAILELATGKWKPIADAPAPLAAPSTGVLVGDGVYLWSWPSYATNGPSHGTWMSYDLSEDEWKRLATPPVSEPAYLRVVKAGNRIVAFHGSEERGPVSDLIYDPATDSWTELPRDPLSPSYDRLMVSTGGEVVLLGLELVPNPGSERPSLVRAAAFDPETEVWRRLPDSEILGGYGYWEWSGDRVVNPVPRSGDGGQVNNYGRDYPHGGMLDPTRGDWFELPAGSSAGPDCDEGGEPYESSVRYHAAGPDVVVHNGLALHVREGRWERVPCHAPQADFKSTSAWAFDGLVVFGGYDASLEEGQQLTKYEFSNAAWIWRPSGG